jgi:hypothetical protein
VPQNHGEERRNAMNGTIESFDILFVNNSQKEAVLIVVGHISERERAAKQDGGLRLDRGRAFCICE